MNLVSKTWKFTDYDMGKRSFYENCDCNVIAFSEELCPSTGRPHIQGHITFKRAYRLKALKKLSDAHWEIALCSDFNYEIKGENLFIKDNRKKKGARTDLESIAEMVDKGASLREVALAYPGQFIRYGRGIRDYMAVTIEPRNEVPSVTVIHGKTGTGKSRAARDLCPEPRWIWTPARGHWFDGYTGQKNVIFEEFRGQLPLGDFLTLTDRYECPVQYKGGTTEFCATNIVITSPTHPKEWYHRCENEEVWKQLERRINEIIDSDCNL